MDTMAQKGASSAQFCSLQKAFSLLRSQLMQRVSPIDDSTLVTQLEKHGTEFGSHFQR